MNLLYLRINAPDSHIVSGIYTVHRMRNNYVVYWSSYMTRNYDLKQTKELSGNYRINNLLSKLPIVGTHWVCGSAGINEAV